MKQIDYPRLLFVTSLCWLVLLSIFFFKLNEQVNEISQNQIGLICDMKCYYDFPCAYTYDKEYKLKSCELIGTTTHISWRSNVGTPDVTKWVRA